MNELPAHVQRMNVELRALEQNIDKLTDFVGKNHPAMNPSPLVESEDWNLMCDQLASMRNYALHLARRYHRALVKADQE
jgi:hypothetical protein